MIAWRPRRHGAIVAAPGQQEKMMKSY